MFMKSFYLFFCIILLERKIEELLDHLKHLADTDSLSRFTQIVGLTYSDFYSYVIIGDGSFIPESIEDREPTDIIEYNGKYFFCFICRVNQNCQVK